MFEYIEKLRGKHDRTKKKIAFSIALVFAVVLFFFWSTVFLPDFQREQEANYVNKAKSPVNNFTDVLSSGVAQIQKNFVDAKAMIDQISTSSAYYKASTTPGVSSTTLEKTAE